ncbi:2127_t:CDS:2 [Ambispora leptoticha]|uniref:2127_t:CDS:1 n=1 Tax=Ambispora leptoticha TaxID=144679 RepID=A0A9N8VSQ0_9GLOM|nr:2127_t:CDS:2 [Ambispora leptoticha]
MSAAFKTKSSYEFLLSGISTLTSTIYSPPFGTSHDMFWQLEFIPSSSEEPDYCAAFLFAIPNHEEANTNSTWARRNNLSAKLFLKNPRNNALYKKTPVKMNSFSAKLSGWGWEAFYKKATLPDQVIFGVEFEKVEIGLVSQKWPLPSNPHPYNHVPDDLVRAWEGQLNNPQSADVQFSVQGKIIYANSAILSQRSKYFRQIFQGSWAESADNNTIVRSATPTIISANASAIIPADAHLVNQSKFAHNIDVPDFHDETFLEMLRFLYTNRVAFTDTKDEDTHTTALDMFCIADKYLIDDLRQLAKLDIFKDSNVNDAAEFLFGTAWKYPELKEQAMKFVVSNFVAVRQTASFKNILANPNEYPAYTDLMNEIFEELFPATGVENTGKPAKDD